MRDLFSYGGVMPDKPFWLNVYQGSVAWPRAYGVTCLTREIAEHCAKRVAANGLGSVAYRLHVTPKPKDRTVDLQDVYGYGPSAPGWKEPARLDAEHLPHLGEDDGSCQYPHCGCDLSAVTLTVGTEPPMECPRLWK